jgi:hypothetical protein
MDSPNFKYPAALVLALTIAMAALSCGGRACNEGDSRECTCVGERVGSQVCNLNGTGYDACVCMTQCQLYAAALETCYDGACDGKSGCAPCDRYNQLLTGVDTGEGGAVEDEVCQKEFQSYNCADARTAVASCR